MRFGVDTGIMVTRNELLGSVPDFDERYFVYKRTGEACRVCGQRVSLELLGGRKLYWCANCQS
jgi:formamidopyrimidine-DNA glycosylase